MVCFIPKNITEWKEDPEYCSNDDWETCSNPFVESGCYRIDMIEKSMTKFNCKLFTECFHHEFIGPFVEQLLNELYWQNVENFDRGESEL